MAKFLMGIALTLSALASSAAIDFSTDRGRVDCDYEINGEFEYDAGEMTFVDDGEQVRIDKQDRLYVDGTRKSLSDTQQELISEYASQVREMIPAVFEVVREAGEIGVNAVTMALQVLFENEDLKDVTDELEAIRSDMSDELDAEHFSTAEFEGEEFGDRIGATVEKAMIKIVPEIAAIAVRAVFRGEDEVSEIEKRAENLEALIEERVEVRAHALESKAEALCVRLERIDVVESQLDKEQLSEIDFIEAT